MAGVNNLYWDPREENKLRTAGLWSSSSFVRMRVQHLRMKDKFPDWDQVRGLPYENVENIRPETQKRVQTWLKIFGDARDLVLGVEMEGN